MKINDRIVNVEERARLMALAHKLGCKVYQRNPETDTWFYYTDGTNIGYVQFARREPSKLCSVHKPSRVVGTGYDAGEPNCAADLQRAMLMNAPAWDWRDSDQVKKWKDWQQFQARDSFNAAYQEVTE